MILEARDVTVFYGDFCALAGVSLAALGWTAHRIAHPRRT